MRLRPLQRRWFSVHFPASSVEQLPLDLLEYELHETLAPFNPTSIHMFMSKRNTVKNAIVHLETDDDLDNFLTPNRLAFGLHIKGKRCPVYNAQDRITQLKVRHLPETLELDNVVSLRTFRNNVSVVTFESYDDARTALEMLHQPAELGIGRKHAPTQPSPYELMLHQVRERVVATEEENARLRAALEKAGVTEHQ